MSQLPDSAPSDPEAGSEQSGSGAGDAVHSRRRRRRRWLDNTVIVLLGLVLVAVLGGTGYVVTVNRSVSQNLRRGDELPPDTTVGAAARPTKADNALNYVLIGSDRPTGGPVAGHSDVLMVLHISGDRKSGALISFSPKLYVPVPGHGTRRINTAYTLGGSPLTVRTVEALLDTRMDHVAVIDLAGFTNLIEALGGVTVDNPSALTSLGFTFPQGRVDLSGTRAVAYAVPDQPGPAGEAAAAERQRLVAQAVMVKGLSRSTLANPAKFNRFAGGLAGEVTVDRGLTVSELRRTALSLRFSPSDFQPMQAPVEKAGTSPSGQKVDLVDRAAMSDLASALRQDELAGYQAEHPTR